MHGMKHYSRQSYSYTSRCLAVDDKQLHHQTALPRQPGTFMQQLHREAWHLVCRVDVTVVSLTMRT